MTGEPVVRDATTKRQGNVEIVVILGLLIAINPLSIDTYLPSMPAIAAEFGVTSALVQQSVSAYFFGLGAGQIVCGPLSDRFGRRPILIAGLGLFLVASVACVLAPTIGMLITARAVQGIAASAISATSRAVIRDVWSGNRAARALSLVMMVMAFVPLCAPLTGGQIFTHLGWRAIFWLMFGFGVLLVVLVLFRLPETHGFARREGVRMDAAFRAYGRVLTSGRAWGYLLCGGLAYATMYAYIAGSPFMYIRFFGVNPQYFGFFFALNVIGLTLGLWLNTRFVILLGYRRMLGVGAAVSLIGVLALLVCALIATGGLTAVVVALFIAVGPVSMVGSNAIAGLLNLYPRNAGAAAALFGVSQYGFGALAGVLVGVFYSGTATAMAFAMTIMAAGSFLAWLALRLSRDPEGTAPL